ncbi:lipase family protein [Ancylobacter terrae]|uniref:lipase family protein n=1 Tax=Ancylobacter sp. sgz301288 TaxID=3342077 RepID=UPI00385DB705
MRPKLPKTARKAGIAVAAAAVAMMALAPDVAAATAADAFYTVAAQDIPGRPGTLLRLEPVAAPRGAASAYRILYRSRGLSGEAVAVSGVVAVPAGGEPRGGRGIVTWGHGTTGIAAGCAPSRAPARDFAAIEGLNGLLAAGDVVVATDYQGLGAGNGHPYLVGVSEAHALIDAARAARHVPGADAGRRVASWGFSEGGHAALFAGALARRYAPDLDLVGVAAASPPTELRRLLRADIGSLSGKVIASYAIWSWSHAYGAPAGAVVQGRAMPDLARIATTCSLTPGDDLTLGLTAIDYGATGFLTRDAVRQTAWNRLIARNSAPQREGAPVFIAQGTMDQVVGPAPTRDYVTRLCHTGARVDYVEVEGASHGGAERGAGPAAVTWLTARLDGQPAPDDCGEAPDTIPARPGH